MGISVKISRAIFRSLLLTTLTFLAGMPFGSSIGKAEASRESTIICIREALSPGWIMDSKEIVPLVAQWNPEKEFTAADVSLLAHLIEQHRANRTLLEKVTQFFAKHHTLQVDQKFLLAPGPTRQLTGYDLVVKLVGNLIRQKAISPNYMNLLIDVAVHSSGKIELSSLFEELMALNTVDPTFLGKKGELLTAARRFYQRSVANDDIFFMDGVKFVDAIQPFDRAAFLDLAREGSKIGPDALKTILYYFASKPSPLQGVSLEAMTEFIRTSPETGFIRDVLGH